MGLSIHNNRVLKQWRSKTTHVKWAFFAFNISCRYQICTAKCLYSYGRRFAQKLVQNHGSRVQKGHFWLTFTAQKPCCLNSVMTHIQRNQKQNSANVPLLQNVTSLYQIPAPSLNQHERTWKKRNDTIIWALFSDFFGTKQTSRFHMLTLPMKSKGRLLNGDLGLVWCFHRLMDRDRMAVCWTYKINRN